MSMTKEEYVTKQYIQSKLAKQGYPTYARILGDFDLNLTNDPLTVGFMEPGKGRIVLNRGLDEDQVSVIIRHEILHQYLEHEKRLLKKLAKEHNLDYDKLDNNSLMSLRRKLYSNKQFNIAGDYEISNRGYTDKDKDDVRNILLNGQVLTGLVTEDKHPDWVDLSIEEMFDKLREENKDLSQQNNQQQDSSGSNSSEGDDTTPDGSGSSQSSSSGGGSSSQPSSGNSQSGDNSDSQQNDGSQSSSGSGSNKDGSAQGGGSSGSPQGDDSSGSPQGDGASGSQQGDGSSGNQQGDSSSSSSNGQGGGSSTNIDDLLDKLEDALNDALNGNGLQNDKLSDIRDDIVDDLRNSGNQSDADAADDLDDIDDFKNPKNLNDLLDKAKDLLDKFKGQGPLGDLADSMNDLLDGIKDLLNGNGNKDDLKKKLDEFKKKLSEVDPDFDDSDDFDDFDGDDSGSPQIGKKGDRSALEKEDAEREKQVEQEGGEKESEEEKAERLKRISRSFVDRSLSDSAQEESSSVIRKERAAKAARDTQRYRTSPIRRFTDNLNQFIKNEVGRERTKTWKKTDPRYGTGPIIRKGTMVTSNGKIPSINVYFDRSASWNAAKTKVGQDAIGTLNNYVRQGKIKINLYYFNTSVHSTDPGGSGGTKGTPIMEHIKQTKPDNVIIMTDSDINDITEHVSVPGAVWLLFKGGQSRNLIDHIKGKKQTNIYNLD